MMYGTRDEFEYLECTSCGCLQITTVPTDIARYYPSDYYSYSTVRNDRWIGRARRKLNNALVEKALFKTDSVWLNLARTVTDTPPELYENLPLLKKLGLTSLDAKFLDVGCGARSWWLDQLAAIGFKTLRGVDPFIERSIQHGNTTITKGELADISGKFDAISFHHSLEHIPDQNAALSTCAGLLSKHGSIIVRIPTVSSTVWKEYGVDWVELDAPRHLYLHSHKSLKIAAERAGLFISEMYCDSVDFEFWGSEQYRRDIPLRASNSFYTDPGASVFSYREIAEFQRKTKAANDDLLGGRIVAILRRNP
jgi:2-polyprenyl-3-methyl-5-hydroxy-6-metoxy-1,4-benzoquinol methylase